MLARFHSKKDGVLGWNVGWNAGCDDDENIHVHYLIHSDLLYSIDGNYDCYCYSYCCWDWCYHCSHDCFGRDNELLAVAVVGRYKYYVDDKLDIHLLELVSPYHLHPNLCQDQLLDLDHYLNQDRNLFDSYMELGYTNYSYRTDNLIDTQGDFGFGFGLGFDG